jgi:ubiquitin-conjugating enzyme E2 D/E
MISAQGDCTEIDPDSPPAPVEGNNGRLWEDRMPVHWRSTRLKMEMKILAYDGFEGINALPLNNAKNIWQAAVAGPKNSPYENGTFYLLIKLPRSYPLRPPIVRFITRIFHPNVSRHGDIGLDCIRHNWTVALSINTLLLSIQSVFTDPYTNVNRIEVE